MIKLNLPKYEFEGELLNNSQTSNWLREQLKSLSTMCDDDLHWLLEDSKKLNAAIEDRLSAQRKNQPQKDRPKENALDYEGAYIFLADDIRRTEQCLMPDAPSIVEKFEFNTIDELISEYHLMATRYANMLVNTGNSESIEASLEDSLRFLNPDKRPS